MAKAAWNSKVFGGGGCLEGYPKTTGQACLDRGEGSWSEEASHASGHVLGLLSIRLCVFFWWVDRRPLFWTHGHGSKSRTPASEHPNLH